MTLTALAWLIGGTFVGAGLGAVLQRVGQFITWRAGAFLLVLGLLLFAAGFVLP